MSRFTQDTSPSSLRNQIELNFADELLIFPRLEEDDVAPHNHGQHMQQPGIGVNVIPGLQVEVSTANEDAVNEHLLQSDQLETDAVRFLLGVRIRNNVITAQHFYRVLKKLRDALFPAKRIKHILKEDFPAQEYERVLLRLVRICTTPSKESYEARGCAHPIEYESVYEAFRQSPAELRHPLSYVEHIDNMLGSLSAGFQMMQQIGAAEVVYIATKDGEEFVEGLRYLAALLKQPPG
ncbi:uncharacterized protein [Physcomitrium patens]|uniref:Uncharacterized protein n=1 Tax=Physcomitrium patens TaxID=3218 RepID=A0A2K1K070_PHYPA|nr:uncharacterized protein LOC112287940 [Physcomitrium patens]PNR47170.1 hypothetical protein PHYPA_014290 [Physcomitrium patens]|eukprot:XP_024387362.1 uncharacterized protein LOC112287940 [Physcomitrella patens]